MPRRRSCPADPNRRSAGGFTLIEIIMALAVFGLGVLALAAIIPMGIKRNNLSSQDSRSSELAAACAERLLNTSFQEPDLTAGTHDDASNPYFNIYNLRWTVEDNQPINSCKRITIKVNVPTVNSKTVAQVVVVASEAGS